MTIRKFGWLEALIAVAAVTLAVVYSPRPAGASAIMPASHTLSVTDLDFASAVKATSHSPPFNHKTSATGSTIFLNYATRVAHDQAIMGETRAGQDVLGSSAISTAPAAVVASPSTVIACSWAGGRLCVLDMNLTLGGAKPEPGQWRSFWAINPGVVTELNLRGTSSRVFVMFFGGDGALFGMHQDVAAFLTTASVGPTESVTGAITWARLTTTQSTNAVVAWQHRAATNGIRGAPVAYARPTHSCPVFVCGISPTTLASLRM